MNIVLTGFMGTGKSAVGRQLADRLGVPFLDLDAAIAKKAGHSIAEIFTHQGESAFRELESQMIEEISSQDRTVIATGGGALLSPKNRDRLQRQGILICLTARVGTLLERLKDDQARPLLAGENFSDRIERLMNERQAAYALCPVQITTDGKTITEVADEILQKISPQWVAA